MNESSKRGVSIIVGSLLSVILVNFIDYFFGLKDVSLIMTLVAMTSSANAIGIYVKLSSTSREKKEV